MEPGPVHGAALDYRLARVHERVQVRRLLTFVSREMPALVTLTARPRILRATGAVAWTAGGAFWAAVPIGWALSAPYALAAPALAMACASVGIGYLLARGAWWRRQHRHVLAAQHDEATLGPWLERELDMARESEGEAGAMMGGLCMLLPMLLHALILLPIVGARDFGRWVFASMVLVGHAHLALGLTLRRAARKWAELDEQALRNDNSALLAVLVAAAVALIPGLILFAIPSMVVLVTGVMIVPAMSSWSRRRLLDQRHELARLRDELQRLESCPTAPEEIDALNEDTDRTQRTCESTSLALGPRLG